MASPPIELRVGGESILDYKGASVTYAIDVPVRTAEFTFSDKWLRSGVLPLPFAEGDACQVFVHGELVLDGFVDEVPVEYDARTHDVRVVCCSWTAAMEKSSAIYQKGSWRGAALLKIATDLAQPFKIAVRADPWAAGDITEPFVKYAIDDEEKALACVQRACERRGVFVTAGPARDLVITKASPVTCPGLLKLGVNIRKAFRNGGLRDRHSYILVKSQRAGNATFFGEAAAGPFVRVEDVGVPFYSPLVIVADGLGSKLEMLRRASWERNVRAGRSRRLTYEVLGLRSERKTAWPINEMIAIDDSYSGQKGPLLISGVTLSCAPGGAEVAHLEVAHPSAFDVLVPPAKRPPGKAQKGFLASL